ncbi:MAG: hypothetical protein KAV00_01965 [Phycisphaerae bacterium]|nr:hypothetical protein [Phycisphaerae bacterium]
MTNLADHWDDSNYLPEGWHDVVVKEFKLIDRDPPGVSFTVVHQESGQQCETDAFWLANAPGSSATGSPLFRLAGFAKACGLSREESAHYDIDDPNSHAMLVGLKLRVLVTLEKEKYHRATEWAAWQQFDTTKAPSPPGRLAAPNPMVRSSISLPDTPGFQPKPLGPEVPF